MSETEETYEDWVRGLCPEAESWAVELIAETLRDRDKRIAKFMLALAGEKQPQPQTEVTDHD